MLRPDQRVHLQPVRAGAQGGPGGVYSSGAYGDIRRDEEKPCALPRSPAAEAGALDRVECNHKSVLGTDCGSVCVCVQGAVPETGLAGAIASLSPCSKMSVRCNAVRRQASAANSPSARLAPASSSSHKRMMAPSPNLPPQVCANVSQLENVTFVLRENIAARTGETFALCLSRLRGWPVTPPFSSRLSSLRFLPPWLSRSDVPSLKSFPAAHPAPPLPAAVGLSPLTSVTFRYYASATIGAVGSASPSLKAATRLAQGPDFASFYAVFPASTVGYIVIEVSTDSEALPQSPFLLLVTERVCEFPGQVADLRGQCTCRDPCAPAATADEPPCYSGACWLCKVLWQRA